MRLTVDHSTYELSTTTYFGIIVLFSSNDFRNKMAGIDALEKSGMYFDDLNRIRVLDDETHSQVL